MTDSTRPDRIIVIADHTPGPHQTDTEDNCTGRDAIFVPCECALGGAR